jgi:hypothetical protein
MKRPGLVVDLLVLMGLVGIFIIVPLKGPANGQDFMYKVVSE